MAGSVLTAVRARSLSAGCSSPLPVRTQEGSFGRGGGLARTMHTKLRTFAQQGGLRKKSRRGQGAAADESLLGGKPVVGKEQDPDSRWNSRVVSRFVKGYGQDGHAGSRAPP
jgi:hypothetical protein